MRPQSCRRSSALTQELSTIEPGLRLFLATHLEQYRSQLNMGECKIRLYSRRISPSPEYVLAQLRGRNEILQCTCRIPEVQRGWHPLVCRQLAPCQKPQLRDLQIA